VQLQGGVQADSAGQQQQEAVFVTARHVLLGVAGNAELSSLLLHRCVCSEVAHAVAAAKEECT
jgi:hypothetical protein